MRATNTSIDGSAWKRTARGVIPGGGSSDAGTATSTAQRRHRIIETSAARSLHTGSQMDSTTDGSGVPESVVQDLYHDKGRPTLEETLFSKLEHHGIRRCLSDEGGAVAKQLNMSTSALSSCADVAEQSGADHNLQSTTTNAPQEEGSGRRRAPNYYLCVPCEVRITTVLSSAPTIDDVASAIRHCSSAAHRLYARCMSLAEIDASLLHSPLPNPSLYTTVVVNGVAVLVGAMPGGSTMFHPDAVETQGAQQHVDDAFFGGTAGVPMPRGHGGRRGSRLLGHTQAAVKLFELMRPRRMLEYLRRADGEGGDALPALVAADTTHNNVGPSTTNSIEPVAQADRVLPSGPKRCVFLYHPLQQFVDATAIWVPCTTRTEQKHNVVRHEAHRGTKKKDNDERSRGWTRIPAACVSPSIAHEYTMHTLTPTRIPVEVQGVTSYKCHYTSSAGDSIPIASHGDASNDKTTNVNERCTTPTAAALRIAVEEESVHIIQLKSRKRQRSNSTATLLLPSGGGRVGKAEGATHAAETQKEEGLRPSLTQFALSQLHDDIDEVNELPFAGAATIQADQKPAATDDEDVRFFDRVRRFSRRQRSQRRQRHLLGDAAAEGSGAPDDATNWS